MDVVGLGGRIRAAREARGLTQGQLAAMVGVSRSAVAQWETGRSGQVGGNLAGISKALDVGVEHLLLGPGGGRAVAAELDWLQGMSGDELALIRLYRTCSAEDRAMIIRLLHRLSGRPAERDAP